MRLYMSPCKRALLNWEFLFSMISGLMASLFALHCVLDREVEMLRVVITIGGGSEVLSVTSWVMMVTGLASMAVGYVGIFHSHLLHFNKHVIAAGLILVINFVIGLVVTEQKRSVRENLHHDMTSYFQLTHFGGLLGHSENWDFLQMKMSCCGVNSHLDYVNGPQESLHIKETTKQWVPHSCCVLKSMNPLPEVENPAQCQHDAGRRLQDSIYLNSRGCHIPVSNWYLRHIATLSAVLFLIICLQAVILFSLSWKGYIKIGRQKSRVIS